MVHADSRYRCYLDTDEEHVFIPGWLPDFSDSDLVSLICPRPFMAQTGKGDPIAWWTFVEAEWKKTKRYYKKLGIGDHAELVIHDGGHEMRSSYTIEFFRKWL